MSAMAAQTESARRGLRRRFAAWMARRNLKPLPIELDRRTVYIVPTGFGWFFAVVVLICVAGGLNYNNNLALLFAFLFAALGSQSMLLTYRNMSGLRLSELHAPSVHAGSPMQLTYVLDSADDSPRTSLNARINGEPARFELALAPRILLTLEQATHRRGWLQPDFLTVWSVWPFGLFEAWSYLWPKQQLLVWPRLEPDAPPLPIQSSAAMGRETEMGSDDIRGLRPYVSGDPMRRIAWKRSATRDDLLVRQFESPAQPELVLNLQDLSKLAWEHRIERLAAWVHAAWTQNLSYRLELGATRIGPDQGAAHFRRCMEALAQLPGAGT